MHTFVRSDCPVPEIVLRRSVPKTKASMDPLELQFTYVCAGTDGREGEGHQATGRCLMLLVPFLDVANEQGAVFGSKPREGASPGRHFSSRTVDAPCLGPRAQAPALDGVPLLLMLRGANRRRRRPDVTAEEGSSREAVGETAGCRRMSAAEK